MRRRWIEVVEWNQLVQQLNHEASRPLAVDTDLEEAPGTSFCLGGVPVERAGGAFGAEEALRAARGVALVPAA